MTYPLIKSMYYWSPSVRRNIAVWNDFIALALLLAIYVVYSQYQHQERMLLVNEPKINDFYFVDYHIIDPKSDERFRFLPIKISSINSDSISFSVSSAGHNEAVSINEHLQFDAPMRRYFFKPEDIVLDRQKVLNWANEGVIYDVARPKNIYINGWIVMPMSDLQTQG